MIILLRNGLGSAAVHLAGHGIDLEVDRLAIGIAGLDGPLALVERDLGDCPDALVLDTPDDLRQRLGIGWGASSVNQPARAGAETATANATRTGEMMRIMGCLRPARPSAI